MGAGGKFLGKSAGYWLLSGVELSVTKVNDSPELHLRFCDSPRCIFVFYFMISVNSLLIKFVNIT